MAKRSATPSTDLKRFQKARTPEKNSMDSIAYKKELLVALRKTKKYGERGEWEKALPHLLKLWDEDPENLDVLTVLCQALTQLGVRDVALNVLERTLQVHQPTVSILDIMLTLAREMGITDVAVKLALMLVEMEPQVARHYVNLATAYSATKEFDTSIDMLQQVIPLFPNSADLWNVLAIQVRARDGVEASMVFFEEALRINPNDFKIYSNYGQSLFMLGRYKEALAADEKSIALNPESPEPRMGLAQIMFYYGNMDKGWENYAYRLQTRRASNQTQIYTHGLESWKGEPLDGKTLLVAPEQGIGDEIMWGNYLPFLYEQADKLVIGCDHRLVDIYKRRFPNAHVERYYDKMHQGYRYRSLPFAQKMMADGELDIDFAIPVGSSPQWAWTSVDEIKPHPDGFLIADPERKAEIKKRLDTISGKPKVALAWRSGLMDKSRAFNYSSVEVLGPLMALSDQVDFINIQYGDVDKELKQVLKDYGVTVHQFDDIDLKMDIEANLAIMDACDVVVSSCSAPGQFSLALGAPTILMAGAKHWWSFGEVDHVRFAKDGTLVIRDAETEDWLATMERVAAEVKRRLALA